MENVNYTETAEGSEMQIRKVETSTRELAGKNGTELKTQKILNAVSNENGEYCSTNTVRVDSATHQDQVPADAILRVTTDVTTPEDGHFYTTVAVGMSKSEMVDLYKSLQYILFEDIK